MNELVELDSKLGTGVTTAVNFDGAGAGAKKFSDF